MTGLALCVAACASPGPAPPSGRVPERPSARGAYRLQSLYRVDYGGPGRDGRLRLVLRHGVAGRFQLQGSDPFGRPLWSLTVIGERFWIVDHRARSHCSARGPLPVPDLGLASLPPASLPRVLAGSFPVEPPDGGWQGTAFDFLDAEGRRWTGRLEGGAVESWTLWGDERPALWWVRRPRGGILSHHRGSQLRWRRSVEEEIAERSFAVDIPTGYHRRDCEEWHLSQLRQDQPPSPGGGPSR